MSPYTIRYLGVHLANDLSWSAHIEKVMSSANFNTLGSICRHPKLAPPWARQLAYQALVRSKLHGVLHQCGRHGSITSQATLKRYKIARWFIFSDYSRYIDVTLLRNEANPILLFHRPRISTPTSPHKVYYRKSSIRSQLSCHLHAPPHTNNSCSIHRIHASTVSVRNSMMRLTIKK